MSSTIPATLPDPRTLLQDLERRDRDHAHASGPPVWGPHVEQHAFWQIQGLARFWDADANRKEGESVDYAQHMSDLLTGLHGAGRTLRYLVAGGADGVGVYLGLEGAGADDPLPVTLRGLFPGVELSPHPVRGVGKALHQQGLFSAGGLITGVPTLKLRAKPQEGRGVAQQIERLLRGLQGQTWGYLVVATAMPPANALALAYQGLERITQVAGLVQQQVSYQRPLRDIVNNQVQTTATVSQDQTDYTAKHCLELLQKNLERLQVGKAEGMWEATLYFFGATPALRDQAGALVRAIFSGPDSTPEPLRVHVRQTGAQLPDQDLHFKTLLNSRELATFCQLPREEFPGFALHDYARFDTDLPQPRPQDPVVLGQIVTGAVANRQFCTIERRDLTKHGLIVGVTGSGKTTTIFALLDQIHQAGKGAPFLVIEPAKTEYRTLLQAPARFPNLRIYTLGDERFAPFRLNPFAFAIGDAHHRIHVQTHIDHLKAVFNAAFVLYAPMPYVLETCLHEVYVDKGWDLATSTNQRLPLPQQGQEAKWPVFPTLSDLYHKVEAVVNRLGYEDRIAMDVKAGLKARIGSLRLGGKGFMLDCQRSVPMRDLLAHPTVLEMSSIGNEDEKAFLLGLLLIALYEHHIVQSQMAPNLTSGLIHLTVLEEAHRLLKNVSTQVDTESANTRGQAVETFTNMLSEVRAYGEGVLIAEQIPTKLAPDAIKNTNLKIVHRLLAGDDREALAATMNMDDAQSRFLTTLRAGQAVVYAEGADHPYLVAMEDYKARMGGLYTSDAAVKQAMQTVTAGPVYEPTPEFSVHFPPALVQLLAQQGITLAAVRNRALQVLEHPDFSFSFDRYLLGILEKPVQAVRSFVWLRRLATQLWVDEAALRPTLLYTVLAAVEQHAVRRGQQYRWAYHRVSNAYAPLQRALAQIARDYPYQVQSAPAQPLLDQLQTAVDADLGAFQAAYAKMAVAAAPYAACHHCQTRCRFRFEAAAVVLQRDRQEAFQHALALPDDALMWDAVAAQCREGALQMVLVGQNDLPGDALLCYALHMARALELAPRHHVKLVNKLFTLTSTPKSAPASTPTSTP